MKVNMTPRLPVETKNFAAMTEKEKEIWNNLLLLKENKEEPPVIASRSEPLADAIAKYINLRADIKEMEAEQEKVKKSIYEALVRNNGSKLETSCGSASLVAFTREEMDKEYLRTVAPEAFTVVPDRLQVNVK